MSLFLLGSPWFTSESTSSVIDNNSISWSMASLSNLSFVSLRLALRSWRDLGT